MHLLIRRTTIEDAAAISDMMGDPDVYPGTLQLPFPSPELWRERMSRGPKTLDELSLIAHADDKPVGSAGLFSVSPSPRRAHTRGLGISVIGPYQGKGVGKALMQVMLDWADNWTIITRIELQVYADNEHAIRLYRQFGFEQEGLFRGHAIRAGKLADTLAMARTVPPRSA
jgi:L-phenylalanine/L-methionine N-acetyltransferase